MLVPPPIATPQIAPCWGLLLLLLAFPVGDSLPSILRQSLSTGPSAHLHQDPSSWDLLLARNLGQGATPRKIICILSFTFKWGLNGGIMPFERNSKNHDKCWSHPGRTNDILGLPAAHVVCLGPRTAPGWGSDCVPEFRTRGQASSGGGLRGEGEDSGDRATPAPPAEEPSANPLQGMPAGPVQEEPQCGPLKWF